MSEIHFVGKTRYEDLTETGSSIMKPSVYFSSDELCTLSQLSCYYYNSNR